MFTVDTGSTGPTSISWRLLFLITRLACTAARAALAAVAVAVTMLVPPVATATAAVAVAVASTAVVVDTVDLAGLAIAPVGAGPNAASKNSLSARTCRDSIGRVALAHAKVSRTAPHRLELAPREVLLLDATHALHALQRLDQAWMCVRWQHPSAHTPAMQRGSDPIAAPIRADRWSRKAV